MGKWLGLVLALVVAGNVSAAERSAWRTPWPLKLPCARFDGLRVHGYADQGHVERFIGAVSWRGRASSLRLSVPGKLAPPELGVYDTIEPIGTPPSAITLTLTCPDRRSQLVWQCRYACAVEESRAVSRDARPRPRYVRWSRHDPDAELGRALVADLRDLIVDGCGEACAAGPRAALDAAAAVLGDGRWQLLRATRVEAEFDAGGVRLALQCLDPMTCTISLSRGQTVGARAEQQLIVDYQAWLAHCGARDVVPNCQWPSFAASFPGWTTIGADNPRNHIPDAAKWSIERYTDNGQEMLRTTGAALRVAP